MANLDTAYKRRNAACMAPVPDGAIKGYDRRAIACVYGINITVLLFFLQAGEHMMADIGGGAYRLIKMDIATLGW